MQTKKCSFLKTLSTLTSFFQLANAEYNFLNPVIFKVYDSDGNGKVSFNDILDILRDLTGQFIAEHQREVSLPSLIIFHSDIVCFFTFFFLFLVFYSLFVLCPPQKLWKRFKFCVQE